MITGIIIAAAAVLAVLILPKILRDNAPGSIPDGPDVQMRDGPGMEYEPPVLFEYSESGTGGIRYCLTVYECSVSEVRIKRTSEDGTAMYIVPREALERCMEIVRDYSMEDWNTHPDYIGPDGLVFQCLFSDDAGENVTVSSSHMPEDGGAAFREIESVLSGYLTEEHRVG